jgi:hypothetical protein
MAHWAEIDKNNIVLRVTVGDNNDPDEGYQWLIDNLGGTWIQTSYNTFGGVHANGGTPLNKNYAGIGYSWDGTGFAAPQPYPSWTLDKETYLWTAPAAMPTDGKAYSWNEDSKSWDEVALGGTPKFRAPKEYK